MTRPCGPFVGTDAERVAAESLRAIIDYYEDLIVAPADRLPETLRRERENVIGAVRGLIASTPPCNLSGIVQLSIREGLFESLGGHFGASDAVPARCDGP